MHLRALLVARYYELEVLVAGATLASNLELVTGTSNVVLDVTTSARSYRTC